MSEHDESDPDRAAIMARRRRFIALALGGLTTGCAPGKPGPSPTSTTGTSGSTTVDSSESGSDSGTDSGTETGPRACLKYDLPPEPESDSGTETGGTTGPRPCLVPPGARP